MRATMRQPASDGQIAALNFASMAQHGIILLLVGPLVPDLMETFGIGEGVTGILLGMGSVGFVAGPLFAGALIDRINVRAALLVGLGIELVFLVLFGIAPLFILAVAANLLLHLGASFVETSANVMPTLRRSTKSAHSVMSLVHMFFSVGAVAGPFLIGLYLDATGRGGRSCSSRSFPPERSRCGRSPHAFPGLRAPTAPAGTPSRTWARCFGCRTRCSAR